jgi:hypothetical protein
MKIDKKFVARTAMFIVLYGAAYPYLLYARKLLISTPVYYWLWFACTAIVIGAVRDLLWKGLRDD